MYKAGWKVNNDDHCHDLSVILIQGQNWTVKVQGSHITICTSLCKRFAWTGTMIHQLALIKWMLGEIYIRWVNKLISFLRTGSEHVHRGHIFLFATHEKVRTEAECSFDLHCIIYGRDRLIEAILESHWALDQQRDYSASKSPALSWFQIGRVSAHTQIHTNSSESHPAQALSWLSCLGAGRWKCFAC